MTRTFSTGEACQIVEVARIQIEMWCRHGLLRPQQPVRGRGNHRRFEDDDVTVMVMARELTRAGLSLPQLQRAFGVLRLKLATTPQAWRSAALFHDYVETVKLLARTFGRGDGYDRWLTEATAHLALMRRASQSRSDDDADGEQMRELLIGMSRLPAPGLTLRVS